MSMCPCETCIVLSMCTGSNSVTDLLTECQILRNYIRNIDCAYLAISILKPAYALDHKTILTNAAEIHKQMPGMVARIDGIARYGKWVRGESILDG